MGRLEDIEAQIEALTGEREATAEESALRDAQLERLDFLRRIELLEQSVDSLCLENATLQGALMMVAALPGFEPNEPYGIAVLAALGRTGVVVEKQHQK